MIAKEQLHFHYVIHSLPKTKKNTQEENVWHMIKKITFAKKAQFEVLPEECDVILVLGLDLTIDFQYEEVQESQIWE